MQILRSLDSVLESHPDFKVDWINFPETIESRFGNIYHMVVCELDGTPLYDKPVMEEAGGASIVPYEVQDGEIRVGLVNQFRVVSGKTTWQVPMGYAKEDETGTQTAARELLEETGRVTHSILKIGEDYAHIGYFRTTIPIYAAEVEELIPTLNPGGDEHTERILELRPFSFSELVELQASEGIQCGISKMALLDFIMYMPDFINSKK